MAGRKIHFRALTSSRQRLHEIEGELVKATEELDETIKKGDLRENSDYDNAKANVSRLMREHEELQEAVSLESVRSSDDVDVIEEGSIIELTVYDVSKTPYSANQRLFEAAKEKKPAFHGIIMFGGALVNHVILKDNIISITSPVGKFLNGKISGDYSVPVPDGFTNLTVTKLYSLTPEEEFRCEM